MQLQLFYLMGIKKMTFENSSSYSGRYSPLLSEEDKFVFLIDRKFS